MYKLTVFLLFAIFGCATVTALPVAIEETPVVDAVATLGGDDVAAIPITLINVDSASQSDSEDPESESTRTARGLGLGLLGAKFGGLGGLGHGFKGFGGFGGLGLGSLHGFGGGLGFKPFFGKHFLG